jgi:MazG family protein
MSREADALARLLGIMRRLRDPAEGCPWDRVQSFATIAPYTIEEAYEVADAIARDDLVALRDELGDLLFQVVYHARLAEEVGAFGFAEVAAGIGDKLTRRHPHVFGAAGARDAVATAGEQSARWEDHKASERAAEEAARRAAGAAPSVLDDLPVALPALTRGHKLGKRVARVGFDWPDHAGAFDKVVEEVGELRREHEQGAPRQRLHDEFGDLLFALCNVARKLELDPEAALRDANAKFERRFRAVEARLAERGRTPASSDLQEMDALWDEVKRAEAGDG